jgi:hypothetical protein
MRSKVNRYSHFDGISALSGDSTSKPVWTDHERTAIDKVCEELDRLVGKESSSDARRHARKTIFKDVQGPLLALWMPSFIAHPAVSERLTTRCARYLLKNHGGLLRLALLEGFLRRYPVFDAPVAHAVLAREMPYIEQQLRTILRPSQDLVCPRHLAQIDGILRHHLWVHQKFKLRAEVARWMQGTLPRIPEREQQVMTPGNPDGAALAMTVTESGWYGKLVTGRVEECHLTAHVESLKLGGRFTRLEPWLSERPSGWSRADYMVATMLHRGLAKAFAAMGKWERAESEFMKCFCLGYSAAWPGFMAGAYGDHAMMLLRRRYVDQAADKAFHAYHEARKHADQAYFMARGLADDGRSGRPGSRRLMVEACRLSFLLRTSNEMNEAQRIMQEASSRLGPMLELLGWEDSLRRCFKLEQAFAESKIAASCEDGRALPHCLT